MAIQFPVIDSHTIAQIDWTDGSFKDRVGKVSWNVNGNPTIEKDDSYDYGFRGNGSSSYAANVNIHGDWTLEVLVQVVSTPSSESNLFGFANSPAGGNGSGNIFSFSTGTVNRILAAGGAKVAWEGVPSGLKHFALVVSSGKMHFYTDGSDAGNTIGNSLMSSPTNYAMFGGSGLDTGRMSSNFRLIWGRVSNVARYTSNFNVFNVLPAPKPSTPPTPPSDSGSGSGSSTTPPSSGGTTTPGETKPAVAKRKGYIQSTEPIDLTSLVDFKDGFAIDGNEPANTRRRVIFGIEDVWYKFLVNEYGVASLQKCPTQNITEDSVLEEGNTIEELLSIKDMTVVAGYKAYPLIAMGVYDGATTTPTIHMGCSWWERQDGQSMKWSKNAYGIVLDFAGNTTGIWKRVDATGNDLDKYLREEDEKKLPKNAKSIGICYADSSSAIGTWRRVNEDGSDFDKSLQEEQDAKLQNPTDAIASVLMNGAGIWKRADKDGNDLEEVLRKKEESIVPTSESYGFVFIKSGEYSGTWGRVAEDGSDFDKLLQERQDDKLPEKSKDSTAIVWIASGNTEGTWKRIDGQTEQELE